MESKENNILELFCECPTKQWHFEEILAESGLSRDKANKWLKKFEKEGLIKRVKEKGKMPYYLGNYDNPAYKNRKRLYALTRFYESGFLNHLQSLKKADTIIIFGSFARSDWVKESDIDIFVYGNCDDLNISKYEKILKRDIQLFNANTKEDLKKMGAGLIKNIIRGNVIKGTFDFLEVSV